MPRVGLFRWNLECIADMHNMARYPTGQARTHFDKCTASDPEGTTLLRTL